MTDLLRPSTTPPWRARLDAAVAAARANPVLAAALAAAVVAAATIAFFLVGGRGSPPPPLTLPRAITTAAAPSTTAGEAVIDVAGAVVHPGVVRVAGGARVTDVVAAAGGTTPDADLDQVNLAARVSDGDRVYVPRRGESAPTPAAGPASGGQARTGPVDVNTASPEQLDALPGVGPATAKAIVEYRTRHGRFRSVDDLLSVPGIGPAKLATLRPLVRT